MSASNYLKGGYLMSKIPEIFGSLVFNETVMKERLPKDTYEALKKTIEDSKPLDLSMANAIADVINTIGNISFDLCVISL